MSDPITEQAIAWFARVQSDRRTRADEDRFDHWLKQDPRHQQAYSRVEGLWRLAGPQIAPRALVVAEEGTGRRRLAAVSFPLAAALAAITIGTVFLLNHRVPISEGSFATAAGAQRQLKLSDGSTITLNTRSEVNIDIDGDRRLVRLTRGEARFNVVKDPGRPFVVDTASARVRALGTAFDVRISSSRVAVTLVEGRVEVQPLTEGSVAQPPVVLDVGQQLALDVDGGKQRLQTVKLERANAWLNRQLIFDAVPLSEAVEEVNRYLAKPIAIEDASLADIRVSGVVRAGSLDSFMGSLESSFPVKTLAGRSGPVLVRKTQ